jgi:hypothetical protein
MTNLISNMFQDFRTNTLPDQITMAVQNAMRRYEPALQSIMSSSSSSIPSAPNLFPTSSPITSVNLGAKVKISTPANFTGARQVNVASWLFEMDQYLSLCDVVDDRYRVAVATSYLKESAFAWWESVCRQPNPPTHSWLAFTIALKDRFQPLAASQTARAQLLNLRQESMSVADYSNKFYSLVQLIPDMSDADQVEKFVRGLRGGLVREVYIREPKTLHEAMTMAQKMETLSNDHRHYSNWRRPYTSSATTTTSSTYTTIPSSSSSNSRPSSLPSYRSTAMDLSNLNLSDATSNSPESTLHSEPEWTTEQEDEYQRYVTEGEHFEPHYDVWDAREPEFAPEEKAEQLQAIQQRNKNYNAPYMPREEFTRCMNEHLCLRCKKPGHIARNCPLPRTTAVSHDHPKRNFH